MDLNRQYDAVIIGAGISGLSLAYYLKLLGKNVIVLDSAPAAGGVIESSWKDGFLLEYGPQTCMGDSEVLALADSLGVSDKIMYPDKSVSIRYLGASDFEHSGRIYSAPPGLKEFVFSRLLSPVEKFTVLQEVFRKHKPSSDAEVSVGDIFKARFGKRITEEIISAMYLGIWGTNPDYLEARTATPFIYNAFSKGESVIKTAIQQHTLKKRAGNTGGVMTFSGGLQVLVDALKDFIGTENMRFSVHTLEVCPEKNMLTCYSEQEKISVTYSDIIFSTPSYVSAEILSSELTSDLSGKLQQISYVPMGILHARIEKSLIPDLARKGFGVLIPPGKSHALLGVIFTSSLFPEHSQENGFLMTCFLGGGIYEGFSDPGSEKVRDAALNELKGLLGIGILPEVIDSRHWKKAIPVYGKGHFQISAYLDSVERQHRNIHFCSNISGGVSIPARIRYSMLKAAEISLRV